MITWKWMMISKLSVKIEAEQFHSLVCRVMSLSLDEKISILDIGDVRSSCFNVDMSNRAKNQHFPV